MQMNAVMREIEIKCVNSLRLSTVFGSSVSTNSKIVTDSNVYSCG